MYFEEVVLKSMQVRVRRGLECAVSVDSMQLDHVLRLKYLGCVLDESSIDEAVL